MNECVLLPGIRAPGDEAFIYTRCTDERKEVGLLMSCFFYFSRMNGAVWGDFLMVYLDTFMRVTCTLIGRFALFFLICLDIYIFSKFWVELFLLLSKHSIVNKPILT